MNTAVYMCLFLIIFLIFEERKHKTALFFRIRKKRKQGSLGIMNEVVQEFIGKECVIYTISNQISGTITELKDGWIVVMTQSGKEALNLEHIGRIREYPRNSKGKKKAIIAD